MSSKFDKLESKLQKLDDISLQAGMKGAAKGLEFTHRLAKTKIVHEDAVASTELFRGGEVNVLGPDKVELSWRSVDHAPFVEYGTGEKGSIRAAQGLGERSTPFPAPNNPFALVPNIVEWITVKPTFTPLGDESVFGLATGISHSIAGEGDGQSGTPAQPFLGPAWRKSKDDVERRVKNEIESDLKRLF